MVAAQSVAPKMPSLLFEPDPPVIEIGKTMRVRGWRRPRGRLIRHHADDAWGAVVQEIVVRYMRDGVQRKHLALEYCLGERTVQEYVSGVEWTSYTAPVMRALGRIGLTYGRLTVAKRRIMFDRVRVLAPQICRLLADDERPEARQIVDSLKLLARVEP